MGAVKTAEGGELTVDGTIEGNPSVLVDSVIVPDGEKSVRTLMANGDARYYLRQAFKHLKVIGLSGHAEAMLEAAGLDAFADRGLVAAKDDKTLMSAFVKAMSGHRIWEREKKLGDFAA